MRKRIVIAAIGMVVVIGSVLFGIAELSGPKKGTLEWHKQEYLAMVERLHGDGYFIRIRRNVSFLSRRDTRSLWRHQDALIRLGWLQQREIVISHWTKRMREAVTQLNPPKKRDPYTEAFVKLRGHDGQARVVVTAVAAEMPKWEEVIHKADVP